MATGSHKLPLMAIWLLRSQMRPIGKVEQEAEGVGAGAWELIAQRLCY